MSNGCLMSMRPFSLICVLVFFGLVEGLLQEAMKITDVYRGHVHSDPIASLLQEHHAKPSFSIDPEAIKEEFHALSDYVHFDVTLIDRSIERLKDVAQAALTYWIEMKEQKLLVQKTEEAGSSNPHSNFGFSPGYVLKCRQVFQDMRRAYPYRVGWNMAEGRKRKLRFLEKQTNNESPLQILQSSEKECTVRGQRSLKISGGTPVSRDLMEHVHLKDSIQFKNRPKFETHIWNLLHQLINHDFFNELWAPPWFNHLHEWDNSDRYFKHEIHVESSRASEKRLYDLWRRNESMIGIIQMDLTSLLTLGYRDGLTSKNPHELYPLLYIGKPKTLMPKINRIRFLAQGYNTDKVMSGFIKMCEEFNKIVIDVKSIEGIMKYSKKNNYSFKINENVHQMIKDLLKKCSEVSIRHELKRRKTIHQMFKQIKTEDLEILAKENSWRSNDTNIERNLNDKNIQELLAGLKYCLQSIPFEGMEPYPALTENPKLKQHLGLSWRINLEKAIFGQVHFLYMFKIINDNDLNSFFSEEETLKLLGRHFHNYFQDRESEKFKPTMRFLLENSGSYVSSLMRGIIPKSRILILHQVLTSTYNSLKDFCKTYNSPMESDFISILEKFGNQSFFDDLSIPFNGRRYTEDSIIQKCIKECKSYMKKMFNGHPRPCLDTEEEGVVSSNDTIGLFGLYGYNIVKIKYATKETQWLLNFYVMKFIVDFMEEDLSQILPKNESFESYKIRMTLLERRIDRDQMHFRFFDNARGACNLPYGNRNLNCFCENQISSGNLS